MSDDKKTRRRSKIYSNSDEQKKVSKPFKSGLGMKITIHRGTNQIGGCVTEYEHNGWRLFVDYGEELPGSPKTGDLQVEGLTHGDLSKSALLITHYHGDHIGCITELPESLPIYMSAIGRDIQQYASEHLSSVNEKHKQMDERLKQANTFIPGKEFSFGPFIIMPIVVDHSAFDASAFKITADGVSVFHTGDFRTHGFRSKKLPEVIEKFIGKVDYVVCEGTNIARPEATSLSEHELQRQFEASFREHKNHIVYLSSTNIDRLFALYHAAQSAGRPFIVSSYQKRMMDIVIGRDRIWGKSRMYKYCEEYEPLVLQYDQNGEFRVSDKFQYLLEQKGCVLIAQANERFDHLIERLPGDTQKYLSMWRGYLKEGTDAYNPRLAQSLGNDYQYLHTSGHCDMKSMRELFRHLQPKAIIPIHTDSPDEFAKLFCDEWPIITLNDGQSISPISSSKADACSARIYCAKELENGTVHQSMEDLEDTDDLDVRFIGNFKTIEDSKFALWHTLYRPAALIGYEIEEEEDLSPFEIQTFDANKNLVATYHFGEH